MTDTQIAFNGSIPEKYDRLLGPVWFDPYAVDLARRLPARRGLRVLELACGTGIATRRIRDRLGADATLVATDLNPPMLERARRSFGERDGVEWQQADATALPFPDATFDAVVCQFGMMFFPDKGVAVREVQRVLVPGGLFIFSTWDSLAHNDLARLAHEVCAETLQPEGPLRFWLVPYGTHDADALRRLLEDEGMVDVGVERVAKPNTVPSAMEAAIGMVEGTPCALELHARGVEDFGAITRAIAHRVAAVHGDAPVRARMQALVCSARRP